MIEGFSCPACETQMRKMKGSLYICSHCQTEAIPERKKFSYSADYQKERGHYEQEIRANKVQTFLSYLKSAHVSIKPKDFILEVGFGGGAILEYLWNNQQQALFGVEAHESSFSSMLDRKFPRESLSTKIQDAGVFKKPVDLVLYLDSFEHLLDPSQHLKELNAMVQKGSRAIVVTPKVDSLSRRCLGAYWPHNVNDHWIFYSSKGIRILWESHGWKLIREWSPQKKISIETIIRHFGQTAIVESLPFFKSLKLWIRFGEMGLVFEKL